MPPAGVFWEVGRSGELKYGGLLAPAQGHPSCSQGHKGPEELQAQKPSVTKRASCLPVTPPPHCHVLPQHFLGNGLPLSFLAFPLAPGRALLITHLCPPFPPPPKHINPAKAATDIGCPPLLVSGPWPLQGRSLTLRYPGRGCGVEGPASHTVLRVSCTLSSSTCGMFQGALGHPSRVA